MNIHSLSKHLDYVEQIAQLHQTEWEHLDPSFTLDKRKKALVNAAGCSGIPSIFIALNDAEFVGTAALVETDIDTFSHLGPWLSAVFVIQSFRNQGIASALIQKCENEAKKAKIHTLYLSTEKATGLYQKLGWNIVEYCHQHGVTVMSKRLV